MMRVFRFVFAIVIFAAFAGNARALQVESIAVRSFNDGTYSAVASARLRASPAAVRYAVLHYCDAPEIRRFFPVCSHVRIENRTAWLHAVAATPMVSNRDFVIARRIEAEFAADGSGAFRLTWRGDERYGPAPLARHVRIHLNQGEWRVAGSGDASLVHYQLRCESGSGVPAWFAALQAKRTLVDYLETIERIAQRLDRETGDKLPRVTGWEKLTSGR